MKDGKINTCASSLLSLLNFCCIVDPRLTWGLRMPTPHVVEKLYITFDFPQTLLCSLILVILSNILKPVY